jgi:hypothetical protein
VGARFEKIKKALAGYSDDELAALKWGVKWKIGRDDLTELAAYHHAVVSDKSLPGAMEQHSFGRVQEGFRQRSSTSSGGGYLAMAATAYDLDIIARDEIAPDAKYKVMLFDKTPPLDVNKWGKALAEAGWNEGEAEKERGLFEQRMMLKGYGMDQIRELRRNSGTNNAGDSGSMFNPKFVDMIDIYRRQEAISYPQLGELRKQYTYRPKHWWETGVHPPSMALNRGKGFDVNVWQNAEDAMKAIYKFRLVKPKDIDFMSQLKSIHSQFSKLRAYTRTTKNNSEIEWWKQRNDFNSNDDMERLDKEALAIYLDTVALYIAGNPRGQRIDGLQSANYEAEVRAREQTVLDEIGGSRNSLSSILYGPIVKAFINENRGKGESPFRDDKFMVPAEKGVSGFIKYSKSRSYYNREKRIYNYWQYLIKAQQTLERLGLADVNYAPDSLWKQLTMEGQGNLDIEHNMHYKEPPSLVGELDEKTMWSTNYRVVDASKSPISYVYTLTV